MLLDILMVLLGAAAGWFASRVMDSKLSLLWCVVLGIIGAIIGGLVARLLSFAAVTLFMLILAVAGALALLYAVQRFQKDR